jgi:hypothetical protein
MGDAEKQAEFLAAIRKLVPRPFQPEPLPPAEPMPTQSPFAAIE